LLPFFSIREHHGPIFALTGNQITSQENPLYDNLIFTAGSEGILRAWYVPNKAEIEENKMIDSLDLSYAMVNAHEETIWDLAYHPVEDQILSSSADGIIKLW